MSNFKIILLMIKGHEVFSKNYLFCVTLIELHINGYDCFCYESAVHMYNSVSLAHSHRIFIYLYTNDSKLWKLINVAAEMDSDSPHLLITGDFNNLQSIGCISWSAPGSNSPASSLPKALDDAFYFNM